MKFSCLMAGYHKDCPEQLREALSSLEAQTIKATEVIFVEDGPLSEDLYNVLDCFRATLSIKSIRLAINKGLGNALNEGLKHCTYDIVLRMDTDDICHQERFEKQIDFLVENDDVAILGTWTKDINELGDIIGERRFPINHDSIYNIIWSCPFAHPTIAFRKKDIIRIGSYNTNIKRRQDYELWMRAASEGLRFANIPEYLLYYRFTDQYYSKNNLKVAWLQAKMGYDGLKQLKVRKVFPYLAVFSPVFRAMLPNFVAKRFHVIINKFDPRKKGV